MLFVNSVNLHCSQTDIDKFTSWFFPSVPLEIIIMQDYLFPEQSKGLLPFDHLIRLTYVGLMNDVLIATMKNVQMSPEIVKNQYSQTHRLINSTTIQ